MKKSQMIENAINSLEDCYKMEFSQETIKRLIESIYNTGKSIERKGNEYYNAENQLKQINYQFKRFAEIKRALLDRNLIIIHKSGMKYDVKYIINPEESSIDQQTKIYNLTYTEKKILQPYNVSWETHLISVSCYGTSRPLEIILGIGYNLGLKFADIPQNQNIF